MKFYVIAVLIVLLAASCSMVITSVSASPGVTEFYDNLAGFNAAAGSPAVVINFDDITSNTDITGLTIHGIAFTSGNPPATTAPLMVVRGEDTYTPPGFSWSDPDNKLFATSGENVLSPGGVELAPGYNPTKENDDLVLTLSTPVSAIGFDVLYQSLDGVSITAITLLDTTNFMIYQRDPIPIPGGHGALGGASFVGFVSDSANIAKILINEYDQNAANPDSNIGFDTIRLARATVGGTTISISSGNLPSWIASVMLLICITVVSNIYKIRKRIQHTQ